MPGQDTVEVLIVELDGQRLGLRSDRVRELLRAVAVTPLPRAAAGVQGVINIRGQVTPVWNLRQWLGMPEKAVEPDDHFVVLRLAERVGVVHVDRALELVRIEPGTHVTTNQSWSGTSAARGPDGLLVLPDLDAFVARTQTVTTPGAAP